MRQDVRPIGEVETSCVERGETKAQNPVRFGEGSPGSERAKAGKEDISRGLESRGGKSEDVFRAKFGDCGSEENEGGYGEDVEGMRDSRRYRLDGDWRGFGSDTLSPHPRYESGQKQWSKGEKQRLKSGRDRLSGGVLCNAA